MRNGVVLIITVVAALPVVGCASSAQRRCACDLAHDTFPEAQAEVRAVLQKIYHDARTANLDGLRASHLDSNKFTKFGPRMFERQNVHQCNETEAAFFASIEDADFQLKDVKIDVVGDVAIATYYPHVSFKKDGRTVQRSGRQTLVFLKTSDGWKIIHEHGTPRRAFETDAG